MSLGTENLGKDKALINKGKGLADGAEFKSNPYEMLDSLFHDDETQIIVRTDNKYISMAAKNFLEEMNLFFNESDLDLPILAVNLEDGVFKFIEHMEDEVSLEIPVEWDVFEKDIRNYINENPIVRKEIQKNPEGWSDTPDSKESNSVEKSIQSVKKHVKTLQEDYNLTMDEIKQSIDKYKNQIVHINNKTKYTAKGNAELQLESGTYNHMVELVKSHGWETDFEIKYGSSIIKYMNSNKAETNIEKRLLSEFGFEYCIDKISVSDNSDWTNRVIEVQYPDQKQEDFDVIKVELDEFEKFEKENNIFIDININNETKNVRIRKKEYSNIIDFLKYNNLYKEVSKSITTEKNLEKYLDDNNNQEISTKILSDLFQDFYQDWTCVEKPVDDKNEFDWTQASITIGTSNNK